MAPGGDAGQQARIAVVLCDRLGLPDAMSEARRLLARSDELGEQVRRAQVEARARRQRFLAGLVAGSGPLALPEVAALVAELGPWTAYSPGDEAPAPAVGLVMEAARFCRGHAHQAAVAQSPDLYRRLQTIAGGLVAEVAGLRKVPKGLWAAGGDAGRVAMLEGFEAGWATMVRAADRFALLHQLAAHLRMMGGLGASALLPDGAPGWGFAYRQWARVDEVELGGLAAPLRLRWAHEHGWEPGLWLAGDLVRPPAPARRGGLLGFLVPSPLRAETQRLGVS